jgi:prepilin-type N-terminal cleavage/methylation domain-containing protein
MNRHGFTLVEALITIVVAGLLGLFSFPTLASSMSRRAAWNARAVAIGMYSRARATALESGRATTLSWTGNVARITATPRLAPGAGTLDTIGNPEDFGAIYGVTVSGSPSAALTIDPRGLGTSASAIVFFTRNGIRDSIIVTGYGRVVK